MLFQVIEIFALSPVIRKAIEKTQVFAIRFFPKCKFHCLHGYKISTFLYYVHKLFVHCVSVEGASVGLKDSFGMLNCLEAVQASLREVEGTSLG